MAGMFRKTRTAVLSLLFMHPDEEFYLRQIARATGAAVGALQRELRFLSGTGIIRRTVKGHQVYFQADERCPVFEDLKSIITKTSGAADVIRAALAPLAEKIKVAFIYGSFARGAQEKHSDLDILIVGGITFGEVVEALGPAQDALRREVNPVVYPVREFAARLRQRDGFLERVLDGKKVFVAGDDNELARLGRKRLDR